jgi:hypothetical protein
MAPYALEVAAPPPHVDEIWPDALAPRLDEFMAYLDHCRPADGALARLAAFDLLDVPDLVAHLVLVDPVDDRGNTRFRFRFVGTWHLLTFGQDVTGRFMDELYNDPLAIRAEHALHGILASGEPHYWRRPSVFHGQQFLLYQRIMAPLADEAGRIVRLAGCYDTANP